MLAWIRSNLRRGRSVYIAALALPTVSLVFWLRAPYPLYEPETWAWFAVVPICVIQLRRPSLVGWAYVVGAYLWILVLQVQQNLGAFEDMDSEDHGRWEGWNTELALLGMTAWLVLVLVLMFIHRPKKLPRAS